MMKPTPPLVQGLPVIGNMLEFMRDRNTLFQRGYEQYGTIFMLKLASKPVVVLAGDEAATTFFSETDKNLRMDKAYTGLQAIFGDIAFTASPEVYNAQRHILHAPFKGSKMPRYVQIMQQETQAWLDSLGDEGEIDLRTALAPLVQNIAAHAIMGKEFRDRMGDEFWSLYTDLSRAIDMILPPDLPLPKFRRRDRAKAKMRAILQPIITERRAAPDAHDDMLQDFANATYKDGRAVEDEVIIGLIMALMFAGHETTVGQAGWTIIELLRNPQYEQMVRSEIETNLPFGAAIVPHTLANLPHVAWAVDETTRTHPSADVIARHAEEDVEVGGYRIPAGALVILSSQIGQHLPETFNNPSQFDPLRFGPGREEGKQCRHAITGFGGGVHKCTGMNFAQNEMMVITSLLFQQYDLELLTPNPQTSYQDGASRPDQAIVRYRRKPVHKVEYAETGKDAAGCPYHAAPAGD